MSKTNRKRGRAAKTEVFNPLAALMPLPAAKVQADMDRNYLALDAMCTKNGATSDQWVELSDCVNTVEMLIEMGEIDGEHAETSQAAIGVMVDAIRRFKKEGLPLTMPPADVEVMHSLLALYQACLERKTWMVIYKAQKACTERVNAKLGRAKSD